MEKLMTFIDKGGTIIAWGQSTALFEGKLTISRDKDKEDFGLPFYNLADQLTAQGLYCPGSLVNINLKRDHPLTLGRQ